MSAVQPRLFGIDQTQTTSDDYYTAKWIFDALGLHFDLDVASPPHPTNVPCDRYYTQADDGLGSPWYGRVWMNPPYSRPGPWVDRWLAHGNGVALLPTSKSRWWDALWRTDAKMVSLPTDLAFVGGRIFMPAVLVAIGQENELALSKVGRVR